MRLITARATSKADYRTKDAQGAALNRVGADKPSMGTTIDLCIPCPDARGEEPILSRDEVISQLSELLVGYANHGADHKRDAEILAKALKQHYKLALRTELS